MSKRRSYYEILGVEQTAAPEEIRAAYRSLAKAFHPDVSQEEDSHDVFAEINSAYAVLSDPEERGRYDYLWRYEQARRDAEAAGGDPDRPLSPEEAERAAALDKLEEVHREAERARRLAKEARRAAEQAKRRARDAKRRAGAAAAARAVTTAGAGAASGAAAASAQQPPAGCAPAAAGGAGRREEPAQGPAAEREARRAAREATQAAKRQAREARRHASQVRYWAQWAEHEVKTVRQAAGLEPAPSSPEELLLWEWQQLQARQRQQQEQEQRQQQKGARGRRAQGGARRGQEAGSGGWEPPAPPPE